MTRTHRIDALVLTGDPAANAPLLRSFRSRGLTAVAETRCDRLESMLRREPVLVIVDVVHPLKLDTRARLVIERFRGGAVLLALHDGLVDHVEGALADLPLDGFIGRRDGACIADVAAWRHLAVAPTAH